MEETTDMTGKTGIDLDVLTWFPPRRCGRNYDISIQYRMLRLTNREWFRGKDHMGSHIPIRQLRRSSVNARPRGETLRGLVVSAVFTNTWATSPLSAGSLFRSAPSGVRAQPWGCVRLSRDISSGFSDSLFFPSALFDSLVRRFGRSSGKYSPEAGSNGSGHQLTAAHRTAETAVRPEPKDSPDGPCIRPA